MAELHVDARWIYYIWFILAVLALDWGRAGLANIEAAALMNAQRAPLTASQLMWHIDMNWSNPLWWLRALHSLAEWTIRKLKSPSQTPDTISLPDALWTLYSCATVLLFVGLSLSGLTMELQDVTSYADRKVGILGPNASTFNFRATDNLPRKINKNWRSGRQTRFPGLPTFYAPDKTPNVSTNYFDTAAWNQAHNNRTETIEVFVAPGTREDVHGSAWGLWANITCGPVDPTDLQMIRTDPLDTETFFGSPRYPNSPEYYFARNYSVDGCVVSEADFTRLNDSYGNPGPEVMMNTSACQLSWIDTNRTSTSGAWPAWLNETNGFMTAYGDPIPGQPLADFLAVADGTSAWSTIDYVNLGLTVHDFYWAPQSPYMSTFGHDNWTFDSLMHGRPLKQMTNAMFEIYMLPETYKPVSLHCDIKSMTGNAKLNGKYHTFSQFDPEAAEPNQLGPAGTIYVDGLNNNLQISPLQVIALGALSGNQQWGWVARPLTARSESGPSAYSTATLLSYLDAINVPYGIVSEVTGVPATAWLTKQNVQYGTYKLLGETMMAMMGEIDLTPWEGELYAFQDAKYLVNGAVSWVVVMVFLSCWAAIVAGGGLWVLLFAGRRWAPSLNGFEMFKFGAQYTNEVNTFESPEFRSCTRTLKSIPGMVGLLPGTGPDPTKPLGFVGLSENEVTKEPRRLTNLSRAVLTLDRTAASKFRT